MMGSNPGRRGTASVPASIIAGLLAAALAFSASCSSAPKGSGPVYAKRNQAAQYEKQGDSVFASGNYPDAMSFYRQALELNISIDDDSGVIVSRNAIGKTYAASGMEKDARGEFETALATARRLSLPVLEAQSLSFLAELDLAAGRTDAAMAGLEKARALATGDEASIAVIEHDFGIAYKQKGEYAQALERLERAAAVNLKLKRRAEYASNCYLIASVRLKMGDPAKARQAAMAALETDKEIENSLSIATDYFALGKISLAEGKDEDAYFYLQKALSVELIVNMASESLKSLDELIPLAIKLGKDDEAKDYKAMREKIAALKS
jgi:tetratricopeptide (TPR) repeat protein